MHYQRPAILATCLLTAPLALSTSVSADRKHTETLLAPFPAEVHDSAVVSPDGRRIAYLRRIGTRQAAVIDGRQERPYDRVAALKFSPDSRWRAYAALAGAKWLIVVNGRQQPAQVRVGTPVFSPNGRRLAYAALQDDGRQVAVMEVNRPPGRPYERIFQGKIVFGGDSRPIAYGARRGGRWYLVVDGAETGPFDFLGAATGIKFSPDGTRVAFAALVDKRWCVVVDGKQQQLYDNVGELAFGPGGRRLAYAALQGKSWRVVVDGVEQRPYDAIGQGTLRFSPDGEHLAYAARKGDKWLAVVDRREFKPQDGIAEMRFSPDGRFLAYTVKLGTALNFTEMVVVNNRPQKIFDRVGGGTLVFSPNSRRLGYIARVGNKTVAVVGGKRGKSYDRAGYLNFSPDSRHYVYAATEGDRVFTVVDAAESAHRYDAIWQVRGERVIFDTPAKFHYLAVKKGNIYLVEEEVD